MEAALPVARRQVRGRPVLRQVAGLDHLRVPLLGLAPQEVGGVGEVAGLVEDEQGRWVEVVEPGRRARRCAPRPRRRRRRAARGPRRALAPDAASPAKRSRSPAEALGQACRPAGRAARRISSAPPGGRRNSVAGRRRDLPDGARCCAGRWDRRRAASRSRRRTARSARAAAPTAGTRRRSRRAARTRPGRRPRSPACSRARRARRCSGSRPIRDARPERPDVRRAGRRARSSPGPAPGRSPRAPWRAPDRHAARAATRAAVSSGHELAALVGQRRPRLEDRDQRRVAEPRAQLLGHAVADLGVARHPADALRVGREREGRGEVRLGAVRDGRQPDVPAVHPGRRRRRRRGARAASRTRRCRGAASGRTARSGTRRPAPRDDEPARPTVVAAADRLGRTAVATPGCRRARPRAGRGIEQLDLGLDRGPLEVELAARSPRRRPAARPTRGRPSRRRSAAGSSARDTDRPSSLAALLAVAPAPSSSASSGAARRIRRQPVFVRRMPLSSAGPPTSPGFGRSRVAVRLGRRLELEAVPAVGGLGRPSLRPRLDRVRRGVEQDRQPRLLVGPERRQHVVDRAPRRVADPDP